MVISLWILLVLFIGLGILSSLRCHNQAKRIQELQQSLLTANQTIRQREETYAENESRKQRTEEKLRSYLELLDTLINTIPNPIYFKDADGVFQGCNRVFSKKVLGLTRDRIIGKRPQNLPDHIPADQAAAHLREELKMAEKNGFHSYEASIQCADGRNHDFFFSLAPIKDKQGKLGGSVTVLADLTDKNRAAQDRLHKERLEGVLETAGAVCHELNQPLQALSGYAELIAAQLSGHAAESFIAKLFTQIERMQNITEKLQGITRYEATDYSGDTKIIDIHKASAKG